MKKTIMVINPVTVKDRHEHTAPHAPIWPKMKIIELENKQYNSRECKDRLTQIEIPIAIDMN